MMTPAFTSEAAPGGESRYLQRLRELLRRHLMVYGKWYGALETRQRPTEFPIDSFLQGYLSGQYPDAQVQRAVSAGSAGPGGEPADLAPPGPWRRYQELCARLALPSTDADLLLLLLGPQADGGAAFMLRLLAGGDPAIGLPELLLRAILDPLSRAPEQTARALGPTGPLRTHGVLRVTATGLLGLAPRSARYLLEGTAGLAELPTWATGFVETSGCAELAQRAEQVLSEVLSAAREVLAAPTAVAFLVRPGRGARWVAAWAAHAAGLPLLETSWEQLASVEPGAVRAELLLRGCALFVSGSVRPATLERAALRLIGLPTAVLGLQLPLPAPALLCRLLERTGAVALSLHDLSPEQRAEAWNQTLARRRDDLVGDISSWPARLQVFCLGVEEMDEALQAGMAAAYDDVLAGVEAACNAMSARGLGGRALMLIPPATAAATLPADLKEHTAELRQTRPSGLVVVRLEADGAVSAAATAALLGGELGVPVYKVALAELALLPAPRALRELRRVLAAARQAEAGLLLDGLAELFATTRALERPFWEILERHQGFVFLGSMSHAA